MGVFGLPDWYWLPSFGQPSNLLVLYSSNTTPYTVGMIGTRVATYDSIGARSVC